MPIKNKGFTLVELIVVISIIAIVGTISFISFNGFLSNSRDSVRLSIITDLEKGFEMSFAQLKKYPTPDVIAYTGSISGTDVVYKGIVGENISKLLFLDSTPKDPKTSDDYVYSVSADKKYYQVSSLLESPVGSSVDLGNKFTTVVRGQYDGYLVYKNTAGNKYITNIPSLLVSEVSSSDLFSTGAYFVVDNGVSLPYGDEPFTPVLTSDLLVVSEGAGVELVNIDISNCLKSTDIIFDEAMVAQFGVNNYNSFLLKNPSHTVCTMDYTGGTLVTVINENSNLYTLGSEIFQTSVNNFVTENWQTNLCDGQNITINTTFFTGGNQYFTTPFSLSGSTIYKVPAGNYYLSGATSATDGFITFGGNCIGLIGAGNDVTNFISSFTSGGNKNAGVLGVRGETGLKKNIIISGLTLENNKISANRYNYGIYGDDKISNITLNDVTVHDSKLYGVVFDDSANYNFLSNITSYNNGGYGVGVLYNSIGNSIKGIVSYGNSLGGIVIDGSSSNNFLEDITSYNNTTNGITFSSTSTGNTLSGAILHGNSQNGLLVDTSSDSNTLNHISSYSNAVNGVLLDSSSSYNTFSDLDLYSNTQIGIYILSGNYNKIINANIYNNGYNGIYIYTLYNYLNNLNVFNNNTGNGNYYGIELNGSSNGAKYNTLNNVNIFNNNKNGLLLQANSDINMFNNLNIFNNTGATDGGAAFYVSSNSTGSLFNNITSYNNQNAFTSYASQTTKPTYYGTFKYFGNTYVSNGAGTFSTNFVAGTGHALLTNGSTNTTGTMGCDWHIKPDNTSLYGASCTTRGSVDLSSIIPITSFTFGTSIPKQTQPIQWNGTAWALYGTGGTDYNTSKYIGEF